MKQLLKIKKMHKLFGKVDDVCRNCKHFRKLDTSGLMARPYVQKCEVYGLTHSESSDWAQKWQACGMFNRPYDDNTRRVIEIPVKGDSEEIELEGQIKFE